MSNGCVWREVTDPIRPPYIVDLAVKSLPLRILEHCWSLQIIRKTRGAYPSTTCTPHHLFLLGLPLRCFLILLHQQGHVRTPGDWSARTCVEEFVNVFALEEGKTAQGAHQLVFGFFMLMYYGLHCLVITAWCASRQALRCKELWDCIINEAPGKWSAEHGSLP